MSDFADITFRAANPDDLAFVRNSWGSSYFKGTRANKILSPDTFHAYHRPIRERFLSKPNTTVIVCASAEDPWIIAGWIAVEAIPEALILQYIYVKEAFQRRGIAKQLIKRALPTIPILYTHLTEKAGKIIARKHEHMAGFRHVPHLV